MDRRLLRGDRSADFEDAHRRLTALGRPVVVRTERSSSPYLDWLRARKIGRSIADDIDGELWLIEPD